MLLKNREFPMFLGLTEQKLYIDPNLKHILTKKRNIFKVSSLFTMPTDSQADACSL